MRTIRFLFALAVLLFSAQAGAAPPITPGQWASFRTSVKAHNADSVATAYQAKNPDGIVAFYNGASGTSIWRSDIKPAELAGAIVMSEYVALSAVQQGGMLLLLQLGQGALDATSSNVRTSFSTLFSGKVTLTNLTAMAQRTATQFEAISAYLTAAAPANVCAPEIYGHILTRLEVATALWDDSGNPL